MSNLTRILDPERGRVAIATTPPEAKGTPAAPYPLATRGHFYEDAELARTINNANVLCIAAKHGFVVNRAIIDAFITTAYTGRKLEELQYITQLESATPFVPLDAAAAPIRPALGSQRRIA